MDTIQGPFRQMVNDGIEPDIFSLNSMVKGYVLSLRVNDALRIFHKMGGGLYLLAELVDLQLSDPWVMRSRQDKQC
ncbi:Pentatricopeptide repeat [Trema orientale]|uniref:Pentatricopeptide repeat n=1 Tax=Trema orientale TaxID=63057 RepID=A0A2P5E4F0_TREOI|nr:Pentatricopeptide repeat [Trema orientale]